MRNCNRVLYALVIGATVLLVLQHAQPGASQTDSEQVPELALSQVKALPGASVLVPLSFSPDLKKPLRTLTFDIEYVSNSLTFEKTSPGLAAEMANAEIRANLTAIQPDDKGLKRARLRIVISLQEPKPKEGLPEGLLAYLVFQIGQDAKPFTIKLTPVVVSAEDLSTPPNQITEVSTEPGSVTIENPDVSMESISPGLNPEVGCFFFTH